MAEVLIRHIIFGVIIMTLVVLSIGTMISTMSNNANQAGSSFLTPNETVRFKDFNKTFNQYDGIMNFKDTTQSAIINPEQGTWKNIWGVFGAFVNVPWTIFKSLFTSLGFISTIFDGLSDILPIPPYVGAIIFSLISILIAFGIYSVISGKDT